VVAVAAFLRVINALENIRSSNEVAGRAADRSLTFERAAALLERARSDSEDAAQVLDGGGLQPRTVALLDDAYALLQRAAGTANYRQRSSLITQAITIQERARSELVRAQ
jgi:hypothetical protein